jgi:hypothetical protein
MLELPRITYSPYLADHFPVATDTAIYPWIGIIYCRWIKD